MFADLPTGVAIGFRVVDADRQFERRMLVIVLMDIDIHDADVTVGSGITDTAEDPLDDVDVMFSAIHVHADR